MISVETLQIREDYMHVREPVETKHTGFGI